MDLPIFCSHEPVKANIYGPTLIGVSKSPWSKGGKRVKAIKIIKKAVNIGKSHKEL